MSHTSDATHTLLGGSYLFGSNELPGTYGPEGLSDETREMAAAVRAFIEGEVVTRWDELDHMKEGLAPELLRQFGELGFFSMEIPETLGGLGLPLRDMLPMLEQLGRCGGFGVAAMVQQGIGMQPIVFVGSDEQCAAVLPSAMAGETLCAYALTEPGYGSDALAGRTTAVLDAAAGEWVINGSKQWITNASWARYFCVFAQVEDDKFTAFLVERDAPGFEVLAEEEKLGIKGSSTCALRLKNVRVPAANRMGEIGKGHKIALNMLNLGRLKLAAAMIGACKQLIAHSVQYTGERQQFGKPISSFGLIRRKLAEMAALTFAGEAMAYRTGALIDGHMAAHGSPENGRQQKLVSADEFSIECSACKVYLTEAAAVCADHAVQCHGGYGFSEEYPVARFYRDVRVSRIYEGTNEINRLHAVNTLMRRLFKGDGALLEMYQGSACGGVGTCQTAVATLKKVFAMMLKALAEKDGDPSKFRPEQDVVGAISDAAIHVYAAESAVLRAESIGGANAPLAGQLATLAAIRAAKVLKESLLLTFGACGVDLVGNNCQPALLVLDEFCAGQLAAERAAAQALLDNGPEWPDFR